MHTSGSTRIRAETAADCDAVREVHRRAFGQDAEGRLVDQLRTQGYSRLSLIAEHDRQVVGHIMFSELCIKSPCGGVSALALAPLAVLPERQRQGIGTALVAEGLRQAGAEGHRIVVVLGHVDYYPRFGFSARLAEPFACQYAGPALMATELVAGALHGLSGVLEYPPPFQRF